MKFFSIKYLPLILLAHTFTASIKANDYLDDREDRCQSSCFECRCESLYECSWGLQFSAGVRPILWRQRNDFYTVNCLSTTVFNDVGELPKFSKIYHVPYQVGGQVSYATSSNTNLFVEFNYASASTKKDRNVALGTSGLSLNLSKYKLYDGYVGARYYFNRRWCNRVSFFLGGKLGFVHHKGVYASSVAATNGVLCYPDFESSDYSFFRRNTVFAGGGQVGLDFCLNGTWAFVITAEVVACCGPKSARALGVCSTDSLILNDASTLFIPGIGNELAFPVTFGVKYNF